MVIFTIKCCFWFLKIDQKEQESTCSLLEKLTFFWEFIVSCIFPKITVNAIERSMKPIKIFNFNISKKKRNDIQTSATTQHILEFDIYEFTQLFIFSKSFRLFSTSWCDFIATGKLDLATVFVASSEGRLIYKNESERMQEGTHSDDLDHGF